MSQIITFVDVDLEKLSLFTFCLFKKLPYVQEGLPYEVLKESELDSYKVKYKGAMSLSLDSGDTEMKGRMPGNSVKLEEDKDLLSRIIERLNELYGIDLTEEDKVDIEKMKKKVESNEELMSFFNHNNARDDVKAKFDEEVESVLLDFVNTKIELYNKMTEDNTNRTFRSLWFNDLYDMKVRKINNV